MCSMPTPYFNKKYVYNQLFDLLVASNEMGISIAICFGKKLNACS